MVFTLPSFLTRFARPLTSTHMRAPVDAAALARAQKATIAAGCFWGVEHIYRKHFGDRGLLDAKVGYIGGNLAEPSYAAVCSGRTGHAEATQLEFDPEKVTYRELIEFFYRIHDPTTLNRQGRDVGTQYRSAIFFHDAEQEKVAREVTKLAADWWMKKDKQVVTELVPAGEWWIADDDHQLYLDRYPDGYQCPTHFVRPSFLPSD